MEGDREATVRENHVVRSCLARRVGITFGIVLGALSIWGIQRLTDGDSSETDSADTAAAVQDEAAEDESAHVEILPTEAPEAQTGDVADPSEPIAAPVAEPAAAAQNEARHFCVGLGPDRTPGAVFCDRIGGDANVAVEDRATEAARALDAVDQVGVAVKVGVARV